VGCFSLVVIDFFLADSYSKVNFCLFVFVKLLSSLKIFSTLCFGDNFAFFLLCWESPVMESQDLVSVSRRVSRPVFLSLGLGLGLERLRSRLGLEQFRSRSRVLCLETLRMSYLFEMIFIILIFGDVPFILLLRYSRS